MSAAGYSDAEAAAIKKEIAHYAAVRDEVKLGAGEDIDFKQYEAGMRFLLDTYIQADASETVADFKDTGLIELIVQLGAGAIDKLPKGIKKDPEAVAETITNNMRKVIIDERAMNPKYYDKMSELLDALIEQSDARAHRLQAVPRAADRPGPAARQARVRHRLPGLGRQRRQARARRLRLPERRTGDRGRHGGHAHQAGPLDRQRDEGEEGQASAPQGAARGLRPTRRALRPGEGAR